MCYVTVLHFCVQLIILPWQNLILSLITLYISISSVGPQIKSNVNAFVHNLVLDRYT